MRLLLQRTIATSAPAAELDAVADLLEGAAAQLAPFQLDSRLDGPPAAGMFETHPITGPSNVLAPPLEVEADGGRAVVTGTYGQAYEGPPGRLHGGFVAAGFDIALGRAVGSTSPGALTGTLTVRYRKATPLFVPVRYEAGVVATEGRKITVRGHLSADGDITAEAEGVWIAGKGAARA